MDLDRLFNPRSVAIVGASPNLGGGKIPYYHFLRAAGYRGKMYPVNPAHKEIEGERMYPSLEAVPDGVDLAICSVPARLALKTVEVAASKGIRFVHFFTSGFSEMGDRAMEERLVAAARAGGTRIVGPNCLGIHSQAAGVTFDPTLKSHGEDRVAFLGQSGGVTNDFTRLASARRLGVSKAVSYGNQIDLGAGEFLAHFAADDSVKVIAGYVEDLKDPRGFLDVLARAVEKKPVILLKGGVTQEGAEAAASHTGALAGSHAIWSAAMRQYGCIEVETQKQLVDVAMMALSEKLPVGPRLAFLGAGGGNSVLFTDLAIRSGSSVPALSPDTQARIAERIPGVNTSTRNPVDLGAFGFNPKVVVHTLEAVDGERDIDAIFVFLLLDYLRMFGRERVLKGLHAIADAGKAVARPVIPVLARFADDDPGMDELRLLALSIFLEAGMPMYTALDEAVLAVTRVLDWTTRAARTGEREQT